MVMMEVDKSGNKFVFGVPQGAPYQAVFEALTDFQNQLLEWQRLQEQQAADTQAKAQVAADQSA